MPRLLRLVTLAWLALLPVQGVAQGGFEPGVVQSPILVVEFDRVYAQSAFGSRVIAEIDTAREALASESREIEAALQAEEAQLTEQRAGMEPDAFRALADAFDGKVQRSREEQDAKARALATAPEEAQRQFVAALRPILAEIMRDANAVAILDRRSVLLSLNAVDITDEAIIRIDAAIGDGSQTQTPEDAATEQTPAQE